MKVKWVIGFSLLPWWIYKGCLKSGLHTKETGPLDLIARDTLVTPFGIRIRTWAPFFLNLV